MAPPNSGPRALEIKKYAPPPATGVLVDTAAMDREVSVVMLLASSRISSACKMPAWPTTKPARINMMTPKMVRIEGVKTPPKVPSRFDSLGLPFDSGCMGDLLPAWWLL